MLFRSLAGVEEVDELVHGDGPVAEDDEVSQQHPGFFQVIVGVSDGFVAIGERASAQHADLEDRLGTHGASRPFSFAAGAAAPAFFLL